MFKFIGFKASLDFIKRKQYGSDSELSSVSVNGAYRISIEDFKDNGKPYSTPKSNVPSMVQLPNSQTKPLKASKSTGDLTKATNSTQSVNRSSQETYLNANNISKIEIKQQKKIEKQRQIEQKKQEKIAAQRRQKEEKLTAQERNRQEKLTAQEKKKQEQLATQERKRQEQLATQERKRQEESSKEREKLNNTPHNPVTAYKLRSKKNNAPTPPQLNRELTNQPPGPAAPKTDNNQPIKLNKPRKETNTTRARQTSHSTDTLESSISKSSGPPPYGEFPEIVAAPSNNITFSEPVDDSSWDLISHHRQQMNKNTTEPTASKKKQLQYSVGNLHLDGKSEA